MNPPIFAVPDIAQIGGGELIADAMTAPRRFSLPAAAALTGEEAGIAAQNRAAAATQCIDLD